jgi:Ca-activated chloride channel homolog
MLTFAWPWMLALLPLPILVRRLLSPVSPVTPALYSRLYASMAATSETKLGNQRHYLLLGLLVLCWLSLVVAAARPQWIGEPIAIPASGRDLMVAVDFSGSMEKADMEINGTAYRRVDVVKQVVGDFLEGRKGDKIGLIVFGEQAYLHAPLTFDHQTVKTLLGEMQLGFAGTSTAIGDAIGIAIKRLEDRPETSRVLILLSDGADTASQVAPRKAAELAADYGVKIYTIGLGAEPFAQRGWFGSRQVNPSRDLDEETLTAIAEITGGQYFRARNPEELKAIYHTLDQLEPVAQEEELLRPSKALFFWPLAAAFSTLLVMLTLQSLRGRRG